MIPLTIIHEAKYNGMVPSDTIPGLKPMRHTCLRSQVLSEGRPFLWQLAFCPGRSIVFMSRPCDCARFLGAESQQRNQHVALISQMLIKGGSSAKWV